MVFENMKNLVYISVKETEKPDKSRCSWSSRLRLFAEIQIIFGTVWRGPPNKHSTQSVPHKKPKKLKDAYEWCIPWLLVQLSAVVLSRLLPLVPCPL